MATPKPDITTNGSWGETGTLTDPGSTKFKEGWVNEIPPAGVQNYAQNRSDNFLQHINEQGVAVWDALTDYPVDGWAKGSDGKLYVSIQTPNVNQDPTSTPAYWEEFAAGGFGDNENTQAGNYTLLPADYDSNSNVVYTGTGGDTFTHEDSTNLSAQDGVWIEHRGTGLLLVDFTNATDTLGPLSLGRKTLSMSPGEKIRFNLTGTPNVWAAS